MSTGGIRIERNPRWLGAADYVSFLNRAFPRQWNRAAYDWYIARPFLGTANDTLVVTEGRRVLAGITVCHRQVGNDASGPVNVGALCAGATLGSERGRGHYGRLLEAARELAVMKGYAALLGFVTRDNASGRGLARRGARAIASFYITSVPGRGPGSRRSYGRGLSQPEAVTAAFTASAPSRGSCVRFLYARAGDWQRQFIDRPNPVRALRLAHDSLALLEAVEGTDRLQWLACPREKVGASIASLASASIAAGRQFFLYTLDALVAAAAARAGLKSRAGCLMLWPTGHRSDAWESIANAPWTVQSGDRV
ncbi:MAG TPA: hypothetical protein VFX20_14430 [Steroidobacteraceae bacterium]|nr:hypothetical protein [Steroidobacteraceae bacterium]